MNEDKLSFALEAQSPDISQKIMEDMKQDIIQVLTKYVDFLDDLDIQILQSGSRNEGAISLIITGHVLFHS